MNFRRAPLPIFAKDNFRISKILLQTPIHYQMPMVLAVDATRWCLKSGRIGPNNFAAFC